MQPPAIISQAPAPWLPAARPWAREAWLDQHERYAARAAAGGIDVLFLGDSIVEFFPQRAPAVWERLTAGLGTVANFGISGDRTQFLLWRIEHGEVAPSGARAVVLMIGTNNLGAASAPAVARGVAADLQAVRARLPRATVVLCALLPRGEPDDPLRAKAAQVNGMLRALADGRRVRWLDAGARLLDSADRIPPDLMPDGLHPAAPGYELWATALRPLLEEALSR